MQKQESFVFASSHSSATELVVSRRQVNSVRFVLRNYYIISMYPADEFAIYWNEVISFCRFLSRNFHVKHLKLNLNQAPPY